MDKLDIEKNRLDLAYKRNLQLINIILISGIGVIFAYVGALILNLNKVLIYTFIMVLVGAITYIFYSNVNENLKQISDEIKNLI